MTLPTRRSSFASPLRSLAAPCLALLASLALVTACDDADDSTPTDAPAPARVDSMPTAQAEAQAPTPTSEEAPAPTPDIADEPVLASAASTPAKPKSAAAPGQPAPTPSDLRSPSLLPADTPAANAEAFAALRLGKRDKPPIAGAGTSGIHLDELAVGKGWEDSRCTDVADAFTVDVDERVSLCFRVIHPPQDESVTVTWARDGKVRQRITVDVDPRHAYLTRAWLPVRKGKVGDWTATVLSDDGTVLGQATFTISS